MYHWISNARMKVVKWTGLTVLGKIKASIGHNEVCHRKGKEREGSY